MHEKILIVDDEENIGRLYADELSLDGFDVLVANSGESALTAIEDAVPDLVVLDIKMDDMSGLDILGQLKQKNRDLPVILNSAYSTYKDDFMSWLADAYVVKSSDLKELKVKIRELLAI